jgi:hypothetical protein
MVGSWPEGRALLPRIDGLSVQVGALTGRIEQELIAKIGIGMTRFAASGHLVSWARSALRARQPLADSDAGFTGLGPDWHDCITPLRRKRQLVAGLEWLSGEKVILQEAAAWHLPASSALR